MIAHSGAIACSLDINSQFNISPPRTSRRSGRIALSAPPSMRAFKCDGTIFRQFTGRRRKYSAKDCESKIRSQEITCRHPPPHKEAYMEVFPRSAAIVETVAKL